LQPLFNGADLEYQFNISEIVDIVEGLRKLWSDVTVTDSITFTSNSGRPITDILPTSDATVHTIKKRLYSSVTTVDSSNVYPSNSELVSRSASTSDLFSFIISTSPADFATTADSLVLSIIKSHSDNVFIDEHGELSGNERILKLDIVTATDAYTILISKDLASSAATEDNQVYGYGHSTEDTVTTSSGHEFKIALERFDTQFVSGSQPSFIVTSKIDSGATATDTQVVSAESSDSLLDEAPTSDDVSLAMSYQRSIYDAVLVDDELSYFSGAAIARIDSVSLSDVIGLSADYSDNISTVVSAGDSISKTLFQPQSDAISAADFIEITNAFKLEIFDSVVTDGSVYTSLGHDRVVNGAPLNTNTLN